MAIGGLVAIAAPTAPPAAAVPSPTVTTWRAPIDGPGAAAIGPDGQIWVANQDSSIGSVTPQGDSHVYTDDHLVEPRDIAAGSDGAMWVTVAGDRNVPDTGGIARITTAGAITFSATPLVPHPRAIVAGPDGALWFVTWSGQVGRMAVDGTYTAAGVSAQNASDDIVVGPDGALWFAGGHQVMRYPIDGAMTSMAGAGWGNIAVGSDAALWFCVDGGVGRLTTAGVFTSFPTPKRCDHLTEGSDGAIWFAGREGAGRVTTDGSVTTIPLEGRQVEAVVQMPAGSVWVVEDNDALAIDPTGITGRIVPPIGGITALTAAPAQPILISNGPGGRSMATSAGPVLQYAPAAMRQNLGTVVTSTATWSLDGPHSIGRWGHSYRSFTSPQISNPEHIVVGPDGHAWIVNHGGGLLRIENDGSVGRRIAVRPLSGIVLGADGAFWFTAGGTVGRVTTAGTVTEWSDTGYGTAGAMTRDLDGTIWFADTDALGRISPDGTITHVALPGMNNGEALATGTDGALWFTDGGHSRIGRRSASGVVTFYDVGFPASMIAAGEDGAMWFAAPDRLGRITTPMAPIRPVVSLGDVTVVEGDSWINHVRIPVTLSRPSAVPVSVSVIPDYAAPGWRPRTGSSLLQPGETSTAVEIDIEGDVTPEAVQTMATRLLIDRMPADLGRRHGSVTVVDDDANGWAGIAIGDVRIVDGQRGMRTASVPVTLDVARPTPVSVSWIAVPIDGPVPGFVGGSGTVVLPAGQNFTTIPVPVGPTATRVPGRRFAVWVTANGVPVARAQGIVQIINP